MTAYPDIQPVISKEAVSHVASLAGIIWNEHFPAIIGQAQVDYMVRTFQSAPAIAQQIAEGYCYYLIGPGPEPVGYFAIHPEADNRLFLSKLYIRHLYRGQGWARHALSYIEALCRQQAWTSIWLTCNKHNRIAIAAYEHLGFLHTGNLVTDIGSGFVMDDVTMEKRVH